MKNHAAGRSSRSLNSRPDDDYFPSSSMRIAQTPCRFFLYCCMNFACHCSFSLQVKNIVVALDNERERGKRERK